MYRNRAVAVVVPAFNEAVLIQDTLLGIPDFVDKVYVINDGSSDGTEERIGEIVSKDNRFVLINHKVNKGVGAAIVTGYSRSLKDKMDVTAVMAGDNQMDPLELHKLLDPIVDGEADYAKGNRLRSRDTAKGMSVWRYFGNNILTNLTRIAAGNSKINDPQNGYTAISNGVFSTIDPSSIFTWYGYCNDILVKLSTFGFKIVDIDIPARYGREKSGISYPKYIAKISRLLFNELVWRLHHQPHINLMKRADSLMALGGMVSILGALAALLSVILPLVGVWLAESRVGLIFLIVLGITITCMGYIVKNGGNFESEGWNV